MLVLSVILLALALVFVGGVSLLETFWPLILIAIALMELKDRMV
jgi:hypothetical protein